MLVSRGGLPPKGDPGSVLAPGGAATLDLLAAAIAATGHRLTAVTPPLDSDVSASGSTTVLTAPKSDLRVSSDNRHKADSWDGSTPTQADRDIGKSLPLGAALNRRRSGVWYPSDNTCRSMRNPRWQVTPELHRARARDSAQRFPAPRTAHRVLLAASGYETFWPSAQYPRSTSRAKRNRCVPHAPRAEICSRAASRRRPGPDSRI
jgi:hypothetical protein